jgi:hypothetical protein
MNKHNYDVFAYPSIQLSDELYSKLAFDANFKLSRSFGTLSDSHILSLITPKQWPAFSYFQSFDIIVWIMILLSLALISLLLSIKKLSISNFLLIYYQYSSVLQSEPFFRSAYNKSLKSITNKLILIVWLLMCTVLLSAFASVQRTFFIKCLPYDNIDSWEDLYDKSHYKILTIDFTLFSHYSLNLIDQNKMTSNFNHRIEKSCSLLEVLTNRSKMNLEIFEKLETGEYVFIHDIYSIDNLFMENDYFRNAIHNYHVSKTGGGNIPYFIIFPNENKLLENSFNKL